MNREQRRRYAKKVKNDVIASICPLCNNRARYFTKARGEKDTVVICEVCGQVVRDGEEVTKLLPPGIYVPMPLPALDQALIAEAARVDNDIKEEATDAIVGEGTVGEATVE